MISPGAMMIAGSPNGDEIVKISIVGPLTNMIFGGVILGVAFFPIPASWAAVMFFAAYINAFMAIFNLIPVGILDGFKIFTVNRKLWAAAFAVSFVLVAISVYYTFAL